MPKLSDIAGLLCLQVWILVANTHYVTTASSHLSEIGKPFTFTVHWNPPTDTLMEAALVREGTIHATFSSDLKSCNYFEHRAAAVMYTTDGAVLAINYTLYETTQDEEGEWVLQYIEGFDHQHPPIEIFHLKVFTKIQDLNCEQSSKENTLSISCKTDRVYPKALCMFQVHVLSEDSITQNAWSMNVQYSHKTLLDDFMFFVSRCDLELQVTEWTDAGFYVHVVMYPNITGSLDDAVHGLNTTVSLDPKDFTRKGDSTSEIITTSLRLTRESDTSIVNFTSWSAPFISRTSDQQDDSQHVSGLYLIISCLAFLALMGIFGTILISVKITNVCECRKHPNHIYEKVEV